MSLIVGLDHVNLLVDASDDTLAKARAFYEGLLGLEPLERPANTDSGNPGAWYQCGHQQLHLTIEKDASASIRNRAAIPLSASPTLKRSAVGSKAPASR